MTKPFGYFSLNDYSCWEQTDSENETPLYDQETIDLLQKEIESEQRWASFYAQESLGRKAEIEQLRAKVAELEAQLAKYQNLEPVAWYHPDEGLSYENHYTGNIPLYALEK